MESHMKKYEFKFIRFKGPYIWATPLDTPKEYQSIIEEHGKDGWRLVQIFTALSGTFYAGVKYYEIILEREV
jgi:hypothetical protein